MAGIDDDRHIAVRDALEQFADLIVDDLIAQHFLTVLRFQARIAGDEGLVQSVLLIAVEVGDLGAVAAHEEDTRAPGALSRISQSSKVLKDSARVAGASMSVTICSGW